MRSGALWKNIWETCIVTEIMTCDHFSWSSLNTLCVSICVKYIAMFLATELKLINGAFNMCTRMCVCVCLFYISCVINVCHY